MITTESRKGSGWEDVAGGGIMLKAAKILENNVLHVKAGGEKKQGQGMYPCYVPPPPQTECG